MSGVLSGLRVLDFSTLLPGPMATLFLAEAGAEVIKIEKPGGGDEMRSYQPRWGEDSANFNVLNRGKKSIALDLKSEEGRAKLMPLIESTDIIVEQFRPGVMARLGLSYDDIRALRPDIIYCSISGYGQSGPRAQRAGHDLNYQGDAGLLSLSYGPPQAPVVPAALIADIAGGAYPALRDDARDPDATGDAVAAIIASRPATEWEPVFDEADCCCSIVQTVEEAMQSDHYHARGLFDHALVNADGSRIAALPLPIAEAFRAAPEDMLPAPDLGAHTGNLTGSDTGKAKL